MWFNLVKIVIDILPKPFVPIGNLQQSSESGVVAGCRIEGYGAVAMFELLGIQQVLTELFAQVYIHIAEGALSFDEVVEMLIDEHPFLVFALAHLLEVGKEIGFLLGLIQETELFIDE